MPLNFHEKTGLLITLILLFLSISVFGNFSEKHENKHIHIQEFRFRPGVQSGSDHVMNTLLQIIADGNQKLRVFTRYHFNCNISTELFSHNNNEGQILLRIHEPMVTGETEYRHFDLQKWLIPALLDIHIKIKGVNNVVFRELKLKDLNWQDESYLDSVLTFKLNGLPSVNELELEIYSVYFKYPDEFISEAIILQKALQSYYDAEEQINKVYSVINDLDSIKPETVILDEFRLCEAEATIGHLRFAAFQDFTLIREKDPLGNIGSIKHLRNELDELRKEFSFVISHIDSVLYEYGRTFLEKGEFEKARSAFERAISYNSLYIPAQLSLAAMELEAGMPSMALNRLARFMGKVRPPEDWKNDIGRFLQKLFEIEIARAGKLAVDDRFLDALRVLEELDRFCISTDLWKCPPELKRSLIDVHYGMYRSYLRVAGRAYESGNFPFAVTYIESARQYQQENSRYISSDRESISLLQDVADAYFLSADRAMLYYDYAMAVKLLDEVKKLCGNYQQLICRPDIDNRLAEAETKKAEAAIFRAEYVLTEPMVILPGSGIKQAAEIVKDDLSLGHLKAWAGETDEARDILNHVIEYAIRYDLRSDSIINMRIISLTEMIHQKECELAERDMGKLLQLIPDRLNDAQYIRANQDYQEVRGLIAKHKNCEWSFGDAIAEMSYLPMLARYQELLQQAQGAYFRGAREGFDDFFISYSRTTSFYDENNLKLHGAEQEPLIEFVKNSSNISLMKGAVSYFSHHNEHENAFLTLLAMKDNRLDAREVRDLQELAGKSAALSLSVQDPGMEPSVYLRELTTNDTWFRFYVRSFLSNW
jgi:tetratricopeptide (TPR) repeat protein